MIRLIVGLGNPGAQYERTRHNIGQYILEQAKLSRDTIWKSKFKGAYGIKEFTSEKRQVYFLIPATYMNLSGESVQALAHFYKIQREEILILHDELDLPFGTIVFKSGGGNAGHNGLKSIANCLGGSDFKRLRIGISRPKTQEVADYVLSPFTSEEDSHLSDLLELADKALMAVISDGLEKASNEFSKKRFV